ncbi:hypothetical protein QJS66_18475 [Kocuria rhizophila]|nr:hypothetical protein QJS66_18475 [Kocuria rhizophila]
MLEPITTGLGLHPDQVVARQVGGRRPGWAALLLRSADEVLALEPTFAALGARGWMLAPPEVAEHRFRCARSCPGPPGTRTVTGSLNAGLARWLVRTGRAPAGLRRTSGHPDGSSRAGPRERRLPRVPCASVGTARCTSRGAWSCEHPAARGLRRPVQFLHPRGGLGGTPDRHDGSSCTRGSTRACRSASA